MQLIIEFHAVEAARESISYRQGLKLLKNYCLPALKPFCSRVSNNTKPHCNEQINYDRDTIKLRGIVMKQPCHKSETNKQNSIQSNDHKEAVHDHVKCDDQQNRTECLKQYFGIL